MSAGMNPSAAFVLALVLTVAMTYGLAHVLNKSERTLWMAVVSALMCGPVAGLSLVLGVSMLLNDCPPDASVCFAGLGPGLFFGAPFLALLPVLAAQAYAVIRRDTPRGHKAAAWALAGAVGMGCGALTWLVLAL